MAGKGFAMDYYVAPSGSDSNSGTIKSPLATIMKAQSMAASGDTVYLRGGTYYLENSNITATKSPYAIVNNITKDDIRYLAYGDERPVFDFSEVQPSGYRVTAFLVSADNCEFEGFDVVGVQITITSAHTQSECFRVSGGNGNRFENLAMHDGMGIGWYLTNGSNNRVVNCDAYNNRGLNSYSIGNVDGFGAHPRRTSGTGNMFIGCRAWFNSDDGFDLIHAYAAVVISNCWAFYNGYDSSFSYLGGDGNGFKAGGYGSSGSSIPSSVPRHVVRFSLAVKNRMSGFYANHHTGRLEWINNTAINNSANYNLLCTKASDNDTDVPGYDQYMKNNLGYLGGSQVVNLGSADDNDVSYNYWTLPVSVSADDFVSLDESELTQSRQADGSLPEIDYARLKRGSDLIDAGRDAGFSYTGSAPDLGAFETE
jgi:pectate lyase